MEVWYNAYNWCCKTMVALVLEVMWKMRQTSDYWMNASAITDQNPNADISKSSKDLGVITRVSTAPRMISSMSDVRNTSPYNLTPAPVRTPIRNKQQETKRRRRKIRNSHTHIALDSDSSDVSSGNYSDRYRPMTARMEEALILSYVMSRDSMRYL